MLPLLERKYLYTIEITWEVTMINFDLYQNIFEIDDTKDRCLKVLENIHPKMKELMEQFILNNRNSTLSSMDVELTSNAETLRSTMIETENPKSVDTKKDTSIGKKYYIYLNRKVNGESINLLTLELNGTLKKWEIYVESRFFPLWNLYNDSRIADLSDSMSDSIRMYRYGNDNEVKEVKKQALDTDIKDMVHKNKSAYYFGNEFVLSGSISEKEFLQTVQGVFEQTLPVSEYLFSEKEHSVHTNQLMESLYIHSGQTTINLLNNEYKLVIDPVEETTVIQKTQNFHVYEQDQLIVKGRIQYSKYYRQKIPSQRISVNVNGRNHIFSPIRQLIGIGEKRWTIAKSFKTQNKEENQQRTEDALALLQDHGLEVKDSTYTIGHYSNEQATFKEEAEDIKKRLITAALLFAHVQNKVHLPTSPTNTIFWV